MVYQIAETVGISVGSAHSILHDNLCLSKLSARWVPKALCPNLLNLRSELLTAILLKIEADEDCFFDQIITGDETWVYQYDPEICFFLLALLSWENSMYFLNAPCI